MRTYPEAAPLSAVTLMVVDDTGSARLTPVGEAGTWSMQGLPAGRYRARAVPAHDLNRIGAWWGDTWDFCSAEVVELDLADSFLDGVHELPQGGWIAGLIYDVEGAPVVEARLRATGLDYYNAVTTREAATDASGSFLVSGLDSVFVDGVPLPGNYRVSAAMPGEAAWYHPGTWSSAASTPVLVTRSETVSLDFVLPAGTDLTGQLLDSSAVPIPGAWVRALAGQGGVSRNVTTAADGSFTFEAISGSSFVLTAGGEGFATTLLVQGIEAEAGQLVALGSFSLAPAASLGGTLDGMDDQPGSLLRVIGTTDGGVLAQLSLDPGQGTYLFEGLPAGDVSLDLRPSASSMLIPGGLETPADGAAGALLLAGEMSTLDLVLETGAGLAGRARRRGSDPLARAYVRVTDLDGNVVAGGEGRTDEDGRFELLRLQAGEVLLSVSYEPFCSGDPTWVTRHWPEGRSIAEGSPVLLQAGVMTDLSELALAPDADGDGMDDVWELAWGLDPSILDADADPDGDGLTNLEEYWNRSDPLGFDANAGCSRASCRSGSDGQPAPAALASLLWLLGCSRRRRAGRFPSDGANHHQFR